MGEHTEHPDAFAWPALGRAGAQSQAPKVPPALRRAANDADVRERARAEGQAQGLLEGREAARKEIAVEKDRLKAAIEALAKARVEATDAELKALAEVSYAACRRVLAVEMQTNHAVFEHLVRAGAEHLGERRGRLRVHVSPEDASWLSADLSAVTDVDIIADDRLQSGAVSIRDERRSVDVDLRQALESLFADLFRG